MWKRWQEAQSNYQQNQITIIENQKTRIKFKDKVILIGAGESVTSEIENLKNLDLSNVTVCCCDRSYKYLYETIRIDYVFTLDPMDVEFFKGVSKFESILIAYSGTSSDRIKDWKGKIYFVEHRSDDGIILDDKLKKYIAGTNVFNTAISIIKTENYNAEILTIGNELMFKDYYYFWETERFKIKCWKGFINIDGIYKTTKGFYEAAKWLSKNIKSKYLNFIYTTSPGLVPKIPVIQIKDFIN